MKKKKKKKKKKGSSTAPLSLTTKKKSLEILNESQPIIEEGWEQIPGFFCAREKIRIRKGD